MMTKELIVAGSRQAKMASPDAFSGRQEFASAVTETVNHAFRASEKFQSMIENNTREVPLYQIEKLGQFLASVVTFRKEFASPARIESFPQLFHQMTNLASHLEKLGETGGCISYLPKTDPDVMAFNKGLSALRGALVKAYKDNEDVFSTVILDPADSLEGFVRKYEYLRQK